MAKRKNLKNEIIDSGKQLFWSIVLCEVGAIGLTYVGYKYDPLPPILFAVGTTAINKLGVFNRRPTPGLSVGISSMQSRKRGLLASVVRWSDNGLYDSRRGNDSYTSRKIRYDEPRLEQLFWDVQLKNRIEPVRVFETNLHLFVHQVSKRQRNRNPHPFSRNYFKRRWPEPEYNAMIEILKYCQLIYNRSGGASGRLIVVTPYAAMWQVKNTCTALLE